MNASAIKYNGFEFGAWSDFANLTIDFLDRMQIHSLSSYAKTMSFRHKKSILAIDNIRCLCTYVHQDGHVDRMLVYIIKERDR